MIWLGYDLEPAAGAIPDIRIIPLRVAAIMPVIGGRGSGLGWVHLLLLNIYRRWRRFHDYRGVAGTIAIVRPKPIPGRKSIAWRISIVRKIRHSAVIPRPMTA